MKLLRRHRFMSQRGAALVEFAVIVPLLLVILFGIIEFSILLYDKAMLTNASREGARAGIVYLPGRSLTATAAVKSAEITTMYSSIQTATEAYCSTYLISFGNSSNLTVIPTWSDLDGNGYDSGDSLEVKVNYKFEFLVFSKLIGLFGGGIGDAFNLQAVTIMRLE